MVESIKMRRAASTILISIGFLVLAFGIIILWRRNDPSRLQFEGEYASVEKPSEISIPIGITIEELSIRLPVVAARNKGKEWETTSEGVSFLEDSPSPGSVGNSIFYGHNWGSLLGNLNKAQAGQIIEIYFSDGTKRKFEISRIQIVSPKDISVLAPSEDERITLYTCSGFFDQDRLVVTAVLI